MQMSIRAYVILNSERDLFMLLKVLLRCGADVGVLQEFDQIDFNRIKKIGEERWRRDRQGKASSTTSSTLPGQNSFPLNCSEDESKGEEEEGDEEALGNLLFAFVPGYWQAVAVSDIAAVRKLVNSW